MVCIKAGRYIDIIVNHDYNSSSCSCKAISDYCDIAIIMIYLPHAYFAITWPIKPEMVVASLIEFHLLIEFFKGIQDCHKHGTTSDWNAMILASQ